MSELQEEPRELLPTPIDELKVLVTKYPALRLLIKTFELEFE